jgi:hypothetical protein
VVVHNQTRPLDATGGATTVLFDSPEWPIAKTGLRFKIWADLIHGSGYQSCHLAVPQLFPAATLSPTGEDPTLSAQRAQSNVLRSTRFAYGWDSDTELGAADVDVSVKGTLPTLETIGPGGAATGQGIHYLCHHYRPSSPPR